MFQGRCNVTLGALRAMPGTVDRCDDLFYALYQDERRNWQLQAWACTADPDRPALLNPGRKPGAPIITTEQHRGAFKMGKQKGARPCLVPARPIQFWRDGTRDAVLDYGGDLHTSDLLQIHRGPRTADRLVSNWSDGCVAIVGGGPRGAAPPVRTQHGA